MKFFVLICSFFVSIVTMAQTEEKNIFDIARNGSLTELNALVEKNPDVINEIDKRGFSPLIIACYRGNVAVAEYLIANVKNINYASAQGTALAGLVMHFNKDLAEKLLKKGANPNIVDLNGETALFLAVKSNNVEFVELLLAHNADTSIKDKQQKTVFEYAVESNNQTLINLLKK